MGLLNRLVVGALPVVPKPVIRRFSSRYIAGESLDDALAVVQDLNGQGFMTTLDVLGEDVTSPAETERARDEYLGVLDRITGNGHDANISVKPTQMGLKIDAELCFRNFTTLCEEARKRSSFVRLDMEDRTCTEDTITLYLRLREEFGDGVGLVIQSYLRRSRADVERLAAVKANVRLCKGIYIEPRTDAFRDGAVINRSFVHLLDRLLSAGCYVGIATHDEKLVYESQEMISRLELSPDRYEFQMLLGVDPALRRIILSQGHRLRVYIPYGRDWYAYSTRRLKENPALAGHILRAMFRKEE